MPLFTPLLRFVTRERYIRYALMMMSVDSATRLLRHTRGIRYDDITLARRVIAHRRLRHEARYSRDTRCYHQYTCCLRHDMR